MNIEIVTFYWTIPVLRGLTYVSFGFIITGCSSYFIPCHALLKIATLLQWCNNIDNSSGTSGIAVIFVRLGEVLSFSEK